jgi:hypothetical protein
MSWAPPLNASKPAEGSTCMHLNPEVTPEAKRGIGFMFEEAKFVRYDVDEVSHLAPGNSNFGDAAADIKAAFAGRIEEAPRKYIPRGFTLTVTPKDKSAARLIFDIGQDGKVANWRIGVLAYWRAATNFLCRRLRLRNFACLYFALARSCMARITRRAKS